MQINGASLFVLLVKDLRLQRVAFIVLVAFELLTFVSFEAQFPVGMRETAGVFLQGVTSIGTFVMAYRLLATEEASGSIGFLKTLPLTNDEIYFSKFAFMFGYAIANAAVLNSLYVFYLNLFESDLGPLTIPTVLVGLLVQLCFAVVLVSIATLATSEKAIWVPFPLVILVLNVYTLATSGDGWAAGSSVLSVFMRSWGWYSAAIVVLLLTASVAVVRSTKLKRALVS